MAEQPQLPADVTPKQFFEEFLPIGFASRAAEGQSSGAPAEATMAYKLTGDGGGSWLVAIKDGAMTVTQGDGDANVTFSVSVDDWRDAVLARNGASLSLIIPQPRPGRPDNSARMLQIKGTMALELAREGLDPYRVEMCFNGAAAPRTVMKLKLDDYIGMQEGRLNGQEAFMSGKMRVEGDIAFLMQIGQMMM